MIQKKTKAVVSNFNYSLGSQLFEPKYDIIPISETSYKIVIDIPGEYKIGTKVDDKDPFIIIKGKKVLSHKVVDKWVEYHPENCISHLRTFGEFELKIPLLSGYEKIKLDQINRKRQEGYFELTVEKGTESADFSQD
jgi:HSP20 family molecular chaperone IbpA